MITSLREAYYNKLLLIDGLNENNVFHKNAPEKLPDGTKVSYPYCVFFEVNNNRDGRSSLATFENSYVQCSFYGADQSVLETFSKAHRTAFDNNVADFTLEDYHVSRVDWELSRDTFNEENDVLEISNEHKFLLQAK